MRKYRLKLILGSIVLLGVTTFLSANQPFAGTGAYETNYKIDLDLNPSTELLIGDNMKPGDWITSNMEVQNNGNIDFNYSVSATQQAGSEELYNQIVLTVSDSKGKLYEGLLHDLNQLPLGTIASFQKANITFVAKFPYEAGNEFQRKQTAFSLDFQAIGHEQQIPDGDCFEPPFSNQNFTLHQKSTVPIKFHLHDPSGQLETASRSDVRLEVTGPGVNGGTVSYVFSMKDGTLKFDNKVDEPHYLARFSTFDYPVKNDGTYVATVYVGNQAYCAKEFMVLEHGSRSN
ncbi:hypothetical protein [Brevibacillus sp. SYSU BS000544]|uniref:hypothetical protein n=1 Tax=Brevibacillus sp. SYSU BS000544 TaxID=3416443 RepID=UPI003CE4BA0E